MSSLAVATESPVRQAGQALVQAPLPIPEAVTCHYRSEEHSKASWANGRSINYLQRSKNYPNYNTVDNYKDGNNSSLSTWEASDGDKSHVAVSHTNTEEEGWEHTLLRGTLFVLHRVKQRWHKATPECRVTQQVCFLRGKTNNTTAAFRTPNLPLSCATCLRCVLWCRRGSEMINDSPPKIIPAVLFLYNCTLE